MPSKRDWSQTPVECFMPNEVAQAALRAANDQGISRAELLRRLVDDYLVSNGYRESTHE